MQQVAQAAPTAGRQTADAGERAPFGVHPRLVWNKDNESHHMAISMVAVRVDVGPKTPVNTWGYKQGFVETGTERVDSIPSPSGAIAALPDGKVLKPVDAIPRPVSHERAREAGTTAKPTSKPAMGRWPEPH